MVVASPAPTPNSAVAIGLIAFFVLGAVREAARCGRCLVVVEAVEWPVVGVLPPVGVSIDEQTLRGHAERRLAGLARELGPDVDVDTRVELGRPAEALGRVAGADDQVVIGSSGRTALPRALLGSTAAELVHTCDRPIVVVRGSAELPADGGRVVVGVDGSGTSDRAVEYAFDFAARHGCELVAVHAWSDLPMDALQPVRSWDEDWAALRHQGDRLLTGALTAHRERHPGVEVRRVVEFDRPAHTLLEHAAGAVLLVVGSHGRGAVRSVLLGSVSHAVIYHAPCPVAVLRGRD